MGQTEGADMAWPWVSVDGRPEGAQSADGRVRGTYLHGLFAEDAFRTAMLEELGAPPAPALDWEGSVEEALDRLAAHVARHLDLDAIWAMAAEV